MDILQKTIRIWFACDLQFVFPLSLICVYAILHNSNANRLSYPAPNKLISLSLYSLNQSLYSGPRDPVINIPEESPYDHIIWVVDESIRGDHLGINGYHRETTPYLNETQDNIINFGVGSSASVCSDYSHIILMSGLQPDDLPDVVNKGRKIPSIFQYAEKAGYTPAMIYSPGYEDKPKGYLTKFDFETIKTRFQTSLLNKGIPGYQWDFISLDYHSDIISSNARSFTYFLKYGSHFHYERSYPFEKRIFEPIQDPQDWERTDRNKLINSYDNAIAWNVNDFFKELHLKLKGKKYILIYTSDHGQNLLDHPNIKLTHCAKTEAPREMAMVPFFISGDSISINNVKQRNSYSEITPSHFEIFPTTLQLMGYDSTFISLNYGYTFFNKPTNSKNIFMSGDIFGRSSNYKNDY